MPCKLEQKADGKRITVNFVGELDEDVDLDDIQVPEDAILILDFEKLRHINSCGIREWVRWSESLPDVTTVELHNCPQCLIAQVNYIDGFLPKSSSVESFYVPYYSDKQDQVFYKLLKNGEDYKDGEVNAPDFIEVDGEKCSIDVVKAKYFNFILKKSQK